MPNNTKAFLELVRAGLWEKEVRLLSHGEVDCKEVMRLAEEQSVVGLVAAGIDRIIDSREDELAIPLDMKLQFIGQTMQIEQRNRTMNAFIENLYGRMQKIGLYSILMKGQGIAQCYERPLWRTAGDIDLLFNGHTYDKAKEYFDDLGQISESELHLKKHITYTVNGWDVELHGTMRGELGRRIEKGIDDAQRDIFNGGNVRLWYNGNISVFLPSADNDVIFIFTHILQHFFRGGIGLRQICDWCRLLWTYRSELDLQELESRIRKMGLLSEWKAFAAFVVEYLGMPVEAMPMYSPAKCHAWKAKKIFDYVIVVGNFGHNRDMSYKTEKPFLVRMIISLRYRTSDFMKQVVVFPKDAIRAYWYIWMTGLSVVLKWRR